MPFQASSGERPVGHVRPPRQDLVLQAKADPDENRGTDERARTDPVKK